jgi:hypothetical protein
MGALVFFRWQWRSGFDLIFGDRGDGRFVAFVEEHVYRSLLFEDAFLSPPFFHDQIKTLGYSDAFLLNQIFYAPLRVLGADPMVAQSLAILALSSIGYLFCYLTLRRLGVSVLVASLTALIFVFPNNLFLKSNHQQHFAVYYLAVVAYCAVAALIDLHAKPRHAYLLGASAGGLYGLTFSTGYYIAWFFGLALFIFVPIFGLLAWPVVRHWWSGTPRQVIVLALAAGASFLGALVVFVIIYGPVLSTGAARDFDQYLVFAPRLDDILNVGPLNMVWSNLIRSWHLVSDDHIGNGEVAIALTPMLQALILASTVAALHPRFWPSDHQGRLMRAVVISCAAVCILLYVLTVKVGEHSLFRTLYAVLPGAKAIRVGYRAMVVANLFAALAIALTANRAIGLLVEKRSAIRLTSICVLIGLLGFCVVEQFNWAKPANLSRSFEAERMKRVSDPPPECRAFYVADQPAQPFEVQIDAMMIAQAKRVPTLNGYSGLQPLGWDMYNTKEPNYERKMQVWAINRGIGHICRLDVDRGTWTPIVLAVKS